VAAAVPVSAAKADGANTDDAVSTAAVIANLREDPINFT
jgi:hypothetical protein